MNTKQLRKLLIAVALTPALATHTGFTQDQEHPGRLSTRQHKGQDDDGSTQPNKGQVASAQPNKGQYAPEKKLAKGKLPRFSSHYVAPPLSHPKLPVMPAIEGNPDLPPIPGDISGDPMGLPSNGHGTEGGVGGGNDGGGSGGGNGGGFRFNVSGDNDPNSLWSIPDDRDYESLNYESIHKRIRGRNGEWDYWLSWLDKALYIGKVEPKDREQVEKAFSEFEDKMLYNNKLALNCSKTMIRKSIIRNVLASFKPMHPTIIIAPEKYRAAGDKSSETAAIEALGFIASWNHLRSREWKGVSSPLNEILSLSDCKVGDFCIARFAAEGLYDYANSLQWTQLSHKKRSQTYRRIQKKLDELAASEKKGDGGLQKAFASIADATRRAEKSPVPVGGVGTGSGPR